MQGGGCLREPDPAPAAWLAGLTALAAGVLMLIGFLTPIAGVLAGAEAIGMGLSLLPACTTDLFESRTTMVLAAAVLLAIIVLGPGAISVDARVFGRREIIIPSSTSPPQR
jgi:uncharacterized membrane protein YphA (DoxX/SURF4 family)